MNETLIFSTTNGLVSKIIKWFTRSKISHVAIGVVINNVPSVLHCTTGGVQLNTRDKFLRENTIVHEYRFRDDMSEGITDAVKLLGEKYDYIGLAGYAMFILAWRWFRVKIKNPLASPTAMVCSEFILAINKNYKIETWIGLDPERTTAEDLLKVCKRDKINFIKLI